MAIGRNIGFVAAAAVVVSACGGGGGSGDADAGTAPTVTSGAITAFGSIVVNGRHLRIDGPDTDIEQDGDDLTEADLAIGMLVRVEDDDTGRHVEVDEIVEGPVDSVSGDQVVVMGQTVQTDAGTILDDFASLADLVAGDIVEVHGLRGPGGVIDASHIEREAAADTDEYTVTGRVENHDTGALTFTIGGLEVDYQSAELDDLPGGSWDGLVVEVEDANRTYVAGSAVLVATEVEREDPVGGDAGEEVEIERIITAVNGDGTFVVGGDLLVRADGAEFELGTAADLVVGARVEIEGRLLADGSLQAEEIKFDDNDARLAGLVEQVDATAGTLTVLGVGVSLAPGVELDGFADLSDLSVGADFVEVEGRVGANGTVIAHEIELEDDADRDRELRGPVSQKDAIAGTLVVLGIEVTAGSSTELEIDDTLLPRPEFFDLIVLDATIVEVEWEGAGFTGTGSAPESIEIEDEEDDELQEDDDDSDDGADPESEED